MDLSKLHDESTSFKATLLKKHRAWRCYTSPNQVNTRKSLGIQLPVLGLPCLVLVRSSPIIANPQWRCARNYGLPMRGYPDMHDGHIPLVANNYNAHHSSSNIPIEPPASKRDPFEEHWQEGLWSRDTPHY